MNPWLERTLFAAKYKSSRVGLADEKTSFTFSEISELTSSLNQKFLSARVGPSDRVVVILPRSANLALLIVTMLNFEIVGLTLDPKTNIQEMRNLIREIRPKALVCLPENFSKLKDEFKIKNSVGLNFRSEQLYRPHLFVLDSESPEVSQPSWLLNTSGSTAKPKVVMISSENLIERTEGEIRDFSISSEDVLLNCLPFSHDLGLNQLLTSVYSGAKLIVKSNSLLRMSQAIDEIKVTGITGTPLMWNHFESSIETGQKFCGVKFISVSGGSLGVSQLTSLQKIFPSAQIIKTYGQTETFRTLISKDMHDGSLGMPIGGVRTQILNESGRACEDYEVGELIHFGCGSMSGYLFESEAKSDAGIFTKDLFKRDSQGNHFFIGRRDDMIKRYEQRIQLSEIESVIKQLPVINEAVAIAWPVEWKGKEASLTEQARAGRQNNLHIFVKVRSGQEIDPKKILEYCQGEMSYYKVPDSISIVDHFPMTASLKVDRQALLKIIQSKESV